MANKFLFYSSLACAVIHMIGFVYYRPTYLCSVFISSGIATSIWNHGWTSFYAKWIDRILMVSSLIVHNRCGSHVVLPAYVITVYTLSKVQDSRRIADGLHATTHVIATAYNIRLMSQFPKNFDK